MVLRQLLLQKPRFGYRFGRERRDAESARQGADMNDQAQDFESHDFFLSDRWVADSYLLISAES